MSKLGSGIAESDGAGPQGSPPRLNARPLGPAINLAIETAPGTAGLPFPAIWPPFPFVYAHGALAARAGFDILALRPGPRPLPNTGAPLLARVWLPLEGREVEGLLFFWTNEDGPSALNRGLLVLPDEADDVAFAAAAMGERRRVL